MTERAARRHPALAFPEIRAVRLAPIGATATLVNLSATGVLVECPSRAVPGTPLTVQFEGDFSPASIDSRVIRCEVKGIAADGSLRYHIGLAFDRPITLSVDAEAEACKGQAPPAPPATDIVNVAELAAAITAVTAASAGVVPDAIPRNRW